MKRLLISVALISGLLASGAAQAGQQTVTLVVDNMTCAACPFIVREVIAAVPGVASVDVSFATKTATVTFDDTKTTAGTVAEASANAGYPARPKE